MDNVAPVTPVVETVTPATVTPVVETVAPTPVEAPVAPVVAVETPVVAPVVNSSVAAVTPTATDPTKIVPEKAPEAPAAIIEPVKAPETLLGADKPAEAPKPAEENPEAPKAEETNTEGGQSVEPAPPPTYDPFTLPEGIQLEAEKVTEFTGLLAELEQSGKADHTAVQAFGQKAVEFYVKEVKKALEDTNKQQIAVWEKTRNDWKESFLKDPEIGGNRFQTTVDSALNFIRTHGGTAEQQTEFRNLMETSGLGNHPAMIRLLAKAGSAMSEGVPLTALKPVSAPKSKVTTMYGKN
jgi:hypothetical protein